MMSWGKIYSSQNRNPNPPENGLLSGGAPAPADPAAWHALPRSACSCVFSSFRSRLKSHLLREHPPPQTLLPGWRGLCAPTGTSFHSLFLSSMALRINYLHFYSFIDLFGHLLPACHLDVGSRAVLFTAVAPGLRTGLAYSRCSGDCDLGGGPSSPQASVSPSVRWSEAVMTTVQEARYSARDPRPFPETVCLVQHPRPETLHKRPETRSRRKLQSPQCR